jgi:hypothetical protein
VLDEPEEVQRHVLEVIGQVLGRALDLDQLDALGVVGGRGGRRQALGVDGLPQPADGVAVQGSDGGLDRGVVDQQEPPALGVAAAGRPDRRVEDAGLHVGGDGVGSHPPHGPGGVEGFAHVHAPGLVAATGSADSNRRAFRAFFAACARRFVGRGRPAAAP